MKFNKKIIPLFLTLAITLSSNLTVFATATNLNLNGVVQEFQTEPINERGYILVDGEELGKLIGATTSWDKNTKTLTMTKGKTTAQFKDGNTKYYLNKQEKYLPISSRIVGDKLFVPIGEVCNIFGATVRWQSKTNTVIVNTNSTPVSINNKLTVDKNANVISYEKALTDAINYNSDLKNLKDNAVLLEQQRKQMVSDYENVASQGLDSSAINYMRGINSTQENLSNIPLNNQIIKTQTEFMLISTLNAIDVYDIDIQLIKETLSIQQQNLNNFNLKHTVGLASSVEVKNAKLEIEKSQTSLNKLEIGSKNNKLTLNKLCGYPADQSIYVEYDPKLVPVNVDIESYAIGMTSSDPTIKIKKNNVEQAEYTLATSVGTHQNSSQSETDTTDKVKSQTDLNAASRALRDAEIVMKESIYKSYNDLKSMEAQQKLLELDLKKAKDDYNVAKISLDAGVVTQYDVNLAESKIKQIQGEMAKNIYNYDTLRFAFANPFLLGNK